MNGTEVITAGALASLFLEVIKWVYRWIVKDPLFDFPAKFYVVMIPILSFACGPLLAFLGISGYVVPTDWMGWLKELAIVILSSLVALATYRFALKDFSDKVKARLSKK